ncbi:SDR family oxidoreductase [Paenibacillus barcinonensis]|uniref:3-oxoacyl-[acyl-carrier protein] reductase n=1 Tax=Paenibacillus barcinonensis TaxID=198119 RepID=A0A2V4VUZ8_PAEBA|nr:SDR family oxidoreductase [Paenibacillus barcinonensis]PYE48832.1 3-oxoacyl-[acyl-carrier protein] reductase [Paenibacillus barcinonensis]QKS57742.1 SDR family oxidoreductase [Paenibacillus barcinonensis]
MLTYSESCFKGKVIAVTGASRGIGRETSLLLSQLGASLIVGSRSKQELDTLGKQLKGPMLSLQLDVTEESSVERFVEAGTAHFGSIDAVVHCAGLGTFAPLLETSTEDFDRMIAVNLRGSFLVNRTFGKHMADKGSGKIVNLISIAGKAALPGCGGYSASKYGLLGLSRVLQAELRGKGVEIISVLPGATVTPFWDGMESTPDLTGMIPVESLARHIVYLLTQQKGAYIDEITIMPVLGIL